MKKHKCRERGVKKNTLVKSCSHGDDERNELLKEEDKRWLLAL